MQPEQNEEVRIQKHEERFRNLWDNFKCSSIRIMGVSEEEEEKQVIENLFEKIMKENFFNMAKKNRLPGNPGSSQSPKQVGSKEKYTKTHHN